MLMVQRGRGLSVADTVAPEGLRRAAIDTGRHSNRGMPLAVRRPARERARAMTLDWSVVWQHRDALVAATGTTILLTVATMAIAVPELMRQSETVAGQSFQPIEVYSFAMLVYFALLFPVTRGVDRLYRRVAHLGQS